MRAASRSVRIYPELRAAQVLRDGQLTPMEAWYFSRNYDLGHEALDASFVPITTFACLRALAGGTVRVLEVPELLWARELPRSLALLMVHKCCTRGSSRRVFYAIENSEPHNALFGLKRYPAPVVALARVLVGAATRVLVNAIVFGSRGAQRAYHSLPFVQRVPSALIEELPAKPNRPVTPAAHRRGAVFVGALEARKGLPELCKAWETVQRALPEATLHIVGAGPLANDIRDWAARDPTRRIFCGQLQHDEAVTLIAHSVALIAPSQRVGRWREQIGLPIKEALAAGTTVVTTADTGLASWLAAHDHFVVSDGTPTLSEGITAALEHPLEPEEVTTALPDEDGRVAADKWLHSQREEQR